jgi:hypothetical protein
VAVVVLVATWDDRPSEDYSSAWVSGLDSALLEVPSDWLTQSLDQ